MSKGKPCSICADKNRCKIDEWYVKTDDIRGTARKFRVSEDALGRHISKGHISQLIKDAANDSLKEHGLNLHICAKEIYDLALDSAKDARKAKQFGAVGSCLQPATRILDILNKGEPSNVNLNISSDSDLDAKLERIIQRRKA